MPRSKPPRDDSPAPLGPSAEVGRGEAPGAAGGPLAAGHVAGLAEKVRLLSTAIKAANIGLWRWDLRSDSVWYSWEWKRQLGYQDHEVGTALDEWRSRVHPDDLGRAEARARAFIAAPSAGFENEFRMRHRNGTWLWILAQGSLERDALGRPSALYGSHTDVTEIHEARETERRYTDLIQNARDLVFTLDAEFRLVSVNSIAAELLGVALDENIGRPIWDLVHPDDHGSARTAFAEKLSGKAQTLYRARLLGKDGAVVPVEVNSWLLWRDGAIAGVQGIARDVSDREAAESAVRASQDRYRAVVENASDAIFLADGTGTVLEVNQAACRLLDYPREALAGRSLTDITVVPEDDPIRWADLRQGRSVLTQREMIRRDGSRVPVEISSRLFPDGRLLGIVRDASARRKAEQAAREANAELEARVRERTAALEEALSELEAFASSVAHDLRAPLRAVDGFSQILVEDYGGVLDEEGRRILGRVRGGAQKMGRLVDDLLRLSKVSLTAVRREDVDVSGIAAGIADDLAASDPARRVTFEIEAGLRARADKGLVTILLDNLLRNAWKFTSRHPEARIEVGAEPGSEEGRFFVRDDGAGFDPSHAGQLFQPFQRLHPADLFEGAGIGLAIVERIVRKHGGRLDAEGAPERGATFRFTLER